jgi:4-amino-4-deoxy-L-arabinose transferase-like glycosyltransferase
MLKQIKTFLSKNKILVAIFLLSAVIRFYRIADTPPSLNWDEVSHGYNAYSILKSGKDEWGQTLPLIFRAYGDYKLPVYIYTTIVSVAVFGLNTFAVRLPSVLAGIASVVFTYLLVKELFRGNKLAIGNCRKLFACGGTLVFFPFSCGL